MSELKKTVTLFYGGVVNLGRSINISVKNLAPFVGVKEMASADLRLVNLDCVIATKGEQENKINTYYLRARPEQTNILVDNNIDIVLTASDHAGDYGADALLEQSEILDRAGILHTGSGKNFAAALTPVYKKVGDVTLAIFSVDSIKKSSAATANSPGTAYLPTDNPELWKETFSERIRIAHENANVVIVAPHWGENMSQKPSEETKILAHLLIDLGADAVLGCNSHLVHGVENYKNRPIIYDAGDFLFDSGSRNGGCFLLDISTDGVEKVRFIPLVIRYCQTLRAKESAPKIAKNFIAACKGFNTDSTNAKNIVEINFNPPPRETKIISDVADVKREKFLIEPLAEPRPNWIVDKVPEEAIIPPQNLSGLKLVGYYVPPDCRVMTEEKMLQVETYWTIDAPINKSYMLSIRGVPVRECSMTPYGNFQAHDFLDNMFPTNRWKAGVIYREKFNLLAPSKVTNVDLQVVIRILDGTEVISEYKAPSLIKMHIATLPWYKTEFDGIIYQSEPGKCWTAEQLAKVTGGEWIVPPPEGWFVKSISKKDGNGRYLLTRPTLFTATTRNYQDYYKRILEYADRIDGAIVNRPVENLPPDFPLLKVDDPLNATLNLAIAARRRFQGKVIGVTGSAGKTTTCNMLSFILGKEHKITETPYNQNIFSLVPWVFASVKQDDAYAIIEMASDAFTRPYESITYEIKPHVAVVTSLAPAHVGNVGSLENMAQIKSRILNGMSASNYAVLNRDMPHYEIFEQKAKSLKLNVITFGTHPDATIRMPELANDSEFFIGKKSYKLSCPVPAEQLYDALAVVGVSLAVGVPIEKTLEDLKNFTPVKGRGNVLTVNRKGKNLKIIDSSFNANPFSMKYALEYLKMIEPNKKARVAILGDIAELGKQSIDYHKELAEAMLAAEPDRLLLCGEFMRYPYELVKDKVSATHFETLSELFKNFDSLLKDGDTVLIKSSHATGLSKLVKALDNVEAPAKTKSPAVKPKKKTKPSKAPIAKPDTSDIKKFLPAGITPEQNGVIPVSKLKKIQCGGYLYVDAARAWLAMVRAAAQDNISLSLDNRSNAYRNFGTQIKIFKERFEPVKQKSDDAIQVEFDGKIWQLKPNAAYVEVPGQSAHGYGLAVDIQNADIKEVKTWLDENAASFGFFKEYDSKRHYFLYVKACEEIPARVLDIEKLPPN